MVCVRKALVVAGMVVALVVGGACSDDRPDGPGTLTAVVDAPTPLGAVVLELRGAGVTGVTDGRDRVVSSRVGAEGERHRVVVVGETAGDLSFEVEVEDVAGTEPTAVVLSAVDGDDVPLLSLGGIDVRMSAR